MNEIFREPKPLIIKITFWYTGNRLRVFRPVSNKNTTTSVATSSYWPVNFELPAGIEGLIFVIDSKKCPQRMLAG